MSILARVRNPGNPSQLEPHTLRSDGGMEHFLTFLISCDSNPHTAAQIGYFTSVGAPDSCRDVVRLASKLPIFQGC
jgi:hypothetical protein